MGPFAQTSFAILGDVVGQVMHPEMGGLLVGGNGLQIYPFSAPPTEDLRVRLSVEVVRGHEFWVFVRGLPPAQAYQFRIGSYDGKWMAIARGQGSDSEVVWPEWLTMRPLRSTATTANQQEPQTIRELTIEVVGSKLSLTIDNEAPLVFQDVLVPSGVTSAQIALATWKTQLVVRKLSLERRRSPLMVPSHAVANELLRQGMHALAIDAYRRFMSEHADAIEAAEAHFMLCLAYQRAGLTSAAEVEMRQFLSQHLDHPMAQDAIFELARLRALSGADGLERAVREILSYQESGDYVRSRFCLWLLPQLEDAARFDGLSPNLERALELIKQLIRGSPDEQVILGSYAQTISLRLCMYLSYLYDRGDNAHIAAFRTGVQRCRALGYKLSLRDPRTQSDDLALARHLMTVNDPAETVLYIGRAEDDPFLLYDYVRDFFVLLSLGCEEQLLAALNDEEVTPIERLLRAGLWTRNNQPELAKQDMEWCFRLTDLVEIERTSLVMLYAARMGCYGLGYLPWNLMVDGLDKVQEGIEALPLTAIAGWIAEASNKLDDAAEIYRMLLVEGSGFVMVARQGLARRVEIRCWLQPHKEWRQPDKSRCQLNYEAVWERRNLTWRTEGPENERTQNHIIHAGSWLLDSPVLRSSMSFSSFQTASKKRICRSSRWSIEHAISDGFTHIIKRYDFTRVEIGDGFRDFENAIIRPSTETEIGHRLIKQRDGFWRSVEMSA
jgi:predicted transcriptional regulator